MSLAPDDVEPALSPFRVMFISKGRRFTARVPSAHEASVREQIELHGQYVADEFWRRVSGNLFDRLQPDRTMSYADEVTLWGENPKNGAEMGVFGQEQESSAGAGSEVSGCSESRENTSVAGKAIPQVLPGFLNLKRELARAHRWVNRQAGEDDRSPRWVRDLLDAKAMAGILDEPGRIALEEEIRQRERQLAQLQAAVGKEAMDQAIARGRRARELVRGAGDEAYDAHDTGASDTGDTGPVTPVTQGPTVGPTRMTPEDVRRTMDRISELAEAQTGMHARSASEAMDLVRESERRIFSAEAQLKALRHAEELERLEKNRQDRRRIENLKRSEEMQRDARREDFGAIGGGGAVPDAGAVVDGPDKQNLRGRLSKARMALAQVATDSVPHLERSLGLKSAYAVGSPNSDGDPVPMREGSTPTLEAEVRAIETLTRSLLVSLRRIEQEVG